MTHSNKTIKQNKKANKRESNSERKINKTKIQRTDNGKQQSKHKKQIH